MQMPDWQTDRESMSYFRPVALNGPIVTIRKFAKEAITMKKLMEWQSINSEVSGFLALLVAAGYNIFISGGTGSENHFLECTIAIYTQK